MKQSDRVPTDGSGPSLGQNPFGALSAAGLPAGTVPEPGGRSPPANELNRPPKNRGRVDIRRETQGRGGRTVTVVSGFVGLGQPEKEDLAKRLQKACGVGGTVKEGRIEIQGDKRDLVASILAQAGFRPVQAGG